MFGLAFRALNKTGSTRKELLWRLYRHHPNPNPYEAGLKGQAATTTALEEQAMEYYGYCKGAGGELRLLLLHL